MKIYILTVWMGSMLLISACSLIEAGNPKIQADFDDAVAFLANGSEVEELEGAESFKAVKRDETSDTTAAINEAYLNSGLLKYTINAEILPAITDLKGDTDGIPPVVRMIKLENDNYYVLFNSEVTVGESVCFLVEVDPSNNLRCIDSEEVPAAHVVMDNTLPTRDANRHLFVWLNSEDTVYYLSYNKYTDDRGSDHADIVPARLNADGTRTVLSEQGIELASVVQDSDGILYGVGIFLYGTGCETWAWNDSGYYQTIQDGVVYCRVDEGASYTSLEGEDEWDMNAAYLLSNDQIIVFGGTSDINGSIGTLGDELNADNFSNELFSTLLDNDFDFPTSNLFETDDGRIWGLSSKTVEDLSTSVLVGVNTAEMSSETIILDNDALSGFYATILDYKDGHPIAIAGADNNGDAVLDRTPALFLYDIESDTLSNVDIPTNLQIFSMRYIDEKRLMFGGNLIGESEDSENITRAYYVYEVDTGMLTELIKEENLIYYIFAF
jgi:hypothetical protein